MPSIAQHIAAIRAILPPHVTLICVSKFHPADAIREAYDAGERDFGESHVQELLRKHEALPTDIRWHMIGHLQTNKVRPIAPFVHLIHSVDSLRLLQTIQREGERIGRTIHVLLEVHVAREETKSGFTPTELQALLDADTLASLPRVHVDGIMGMATNTDDTAEIQRCFRTLADLFHAHPEWHTLSMGMSDDYPLAIDQGSTMIRIGSAIFGEREYA